MIKSISTNFQTNEQSLLLNTITGVNCIQSVFPHYKLQQPEVTKKKNEKKTITLNNIETNKINKKRKMDLTLVICYT